MDAVILAGGRGERMTPIIARYMKPLLTVNGAPLVRSAVELAVSAGVEEPVVVTSPFNTQDIAAALTGLPAALVVQRRPLGPADALRVGLKVHNVNGGSYRVLVMLSDNVMTLDDVRFVVRHETAIGVAVKPRSEAKRFTWFDPRVQDWREKIDIPDGDPVECWVGPFVALRSRMNRVVSEVCKFSLAGSTEALIGPNLGLMTDGKNTPRIPVSSVDVGTPESYSQVKEWQ